MAQPDRPILPHKADFTQRAVKKHRISSFADLGGCWGVHAGYTLNILEKNPIERAFVVDGVVTDLSRQRGAKYPQLSFVSGLLGDQRVIDRLENVDALLMYDILLHQVDPDWDRFIDLWAGKARILLIYNQMWERGEETVRFIERGRDWYKENVVVTNEATIDEWFGRLDETDPKTGRRWRDVHNFWQFGIKRRELIWHVESLGFRLDYFENFGQFVDKPWIQNEGFIFVRC